MTDEAKKIINCIYESRGRYGKNIIMDTVLGAKTARLAEIGANEYKSYGVLESSNKNLLRRLIEELLLEGYIATGEYQVLKLGDISRLKNTETKVMVKITDEDKITKRNEKPKKNKKGMDSLTSKGFKLFDKLKELRLEIARAEKIPPYIVFNDKTLIDMCAKMPTTKSDMLNVSGVGENKYGKYGERFIEVIKGFAK